MTGLPAEDGGTRSSSCSGALIAGHWVITAGHCFRDARGRRVSRTVAERTTAVVGRTHLDSPAGREIDVVNAVGDTLIETSGHSPRRDTSPCPHDSGGPYFREHRDGTRALVAVVSSDPGCPHTGPDLSARTDNLTDRIDGTMAARTADSQYPQIWQRAGIPFAELLDILIAGARSLSGAISL